MVKEVSIESENEGLGSHLQYVQSLSFLMGWETEKLIEKLDYELGIDEEEFMEDPYNTLSNIIVNTSGFGIDHSFTSMDVIYNANKALKEHNIVISKLDPDANDDEVIDKSSWKRKTALIYNNQQYDLEYKTPSDVIRAINKILSIEELIFLQKEMDCDTYQYILVKKEKGNKLIADGKLKFNIP